MGLLFNLVLKKNKTRLSLMGSVRYTADEGGCVKTSFQEISEVTLHELF